jgi:hypothetical protein
VGGSVISIEGSKYLKGDHPIIRPRPDATPFLQHRHTKHIFLMATDVVHSVLLGGTRTLRQAALQALLDDARTSTTGGSTGTRMSTKDVAAVSTEL